MLRLNFLMAALLAVALTACPSREDDPTPDAGDECVGECPDAGDNGNDGGDEPDGGDTGPTCESPWEYDADRTFTDDECTPFESDYSRSCDEFTWDGGTKLVEGVEQIRYGECYAWNNAPGQWIRLENAVVVGIDEAYTDSNGVRRNFWVADADDPTMGIWVHFRGTDTWVNETGTPIDEEAEGFERVVLGDIINIEATFETERPYNDRDGRRLMLTNLFQSGRVVKPVRVELVTRGTGEAPAPLEVPACFGDANDGYNRPGQGHVGARIHIPGPLEIINPNPVAFLNVTEGKDTVFGFEVTGGILVNNYKTYARDDDERCDWRQKAIDAAAEGKKVVFPNGITGIWENYTHAPCPRGETECPNNYDHGRIPGTYDYCSDDTRHGNTYTNVLYPQSCEDAVAVIE